MPRPFDVRTDSPASVEQIHSAFGDESYWQARIAEFGTGTITLDSLTVDSGGTVVVATTQDLRHDLLPGVVAKVFRGDLRILRTETWRPVDARRVRGQVIIAASGMPGSGSGSVVLAPVPHGSQLTFTGMLEVKIPLVGGMIEQFVGDRLVVEIPQLQRFTSDWIAQHA